MIDLTHFLVYKTIQKQHNSLKKTKGTKYSHKSVILWKFSLLNLLQTFRPRGVILFFLRTTRGERKSELIQIDCKKEERLGRRKEKKDDRGRVYCILKLPFQWNRNSWLDRHFSTTNNLSLLQVKASDIVSNVNQGGVKSGRSPDQRIHRNFFFFFLSPRFSPSFLAASPLAVHARSRTTVTQQKNKRLLAV